MSRRCRGSAGAIAAGLPAPWLSSGPGGSAASLMSFRYLRTVPAVPTIEIEPPTTTVWGSPASVPSALAIAVVAALPPRRSAFRP